MTELVLTESDQALLNGESGEGAAVAMRVVTAVARSMGAPRLVDIESAHVDGCFYVGPVSIDYARVLVEGDARVRVPTTLNVGPIDQRHPERWSGTSQAATNARTVMGLYEKLGCQTTWTCAPYLLRDRPRFGSQIAWGESNAIVFANSVLGARTQRYGDFVDVAAAVTGRAPFAGLHTDEGRSGELLIDVTGLSPSVIEHEAFFPVLGHIAGQWCGGRIPVVVGVDAATEDDLKAFGAATASTGAVALFHVVGVTPEAETAEMAFQGRAPVETIRVGVEDLRRGWSELSTRNDGLLSAVCLGTPHFSIAEFHQLASLLDGRSIHPRTPLYVNAGRWVYDSIVAQGVGSRLEEAGVQVVTDACTYNTPILDKMEGLVMTNSAKWAWYAPRQIGAEVLFAGLSACVESAIEGRVVSHAGF
ncbi:aconitase X [Rhodococcus sp. IEGM1428]|uniref:aconitase X n=1 Tax=Rhodococcus sp. IEGM1428 TaxID=3392191 RepID=UPI003D0AC5D6